MCLKGLVGFINMTILRHLRSAYGGSLTYRISGWEIGYSEVSLMTSDNCELTIFAVTMCFLADKA